MGYCYYKVSGIRTGRLDSECVVLQIKVPFRIPNIVRHPYRKGPINPKPWHKQANRPLWKRGQKPDCAEACNTCAATCVGTTKKARNRQFPGLLHPGTRKRRKTRTTPVPHLRGRYGPFRTSTPSLFGLPRAPCSTVAWMQCSKERERRLDGPTRPGQSTSRTRTSASAVSRKFTPASSKLLALNPKP